jgi:hypothetical protein
LVGEIVYQLRVLAVLSSQQLLRLEHRRVNLNGSVALEHLTDGLEGLLPDAHLLGTKVARAFRNLRADAGPRDIEVLHQLGAEVVEAVFSSIQRVQH